MDTERGFEHERDWTQGPAKWGAVVVLGTACVLTSAWVMTGRVRIEREAIAATLPPPAETPRTPTPVAKPAAPLSMVGEPLGPVADAPASEPAPTTSEDSTAAADPPGIARLININTASAAELELLPGVGPKLAERIIEHRRVHGAFKSVDGLDGVSGIGPRILERMRAMVTVE